MKNLTEISIVCTAQTALKKLNKAQIAVYNCKKSGAEFIFCIKDKDYAKVFAIFSKACYNIKVKRKSPLSRFVSALYLRLGLVAGCVIFVAFALVMQTFVLKIEVTGSGKYLSAEAERIVAEEGARRFSTAENFNKASATGRILSLPQVTFCNIEKRGGTLIIDIQTEEGQTPKSEKGNLVSDCDGVVKNVVAVCGTAAVKAGDSVKKGDILIFSRIETENGAVDSLAAGYAEIEFSSSYEYFAEEESEENLKAAKAQRLLDEDEVTFKSIKVSPTEGGVIYLIEISVLHKLSINIS